MILSETYNAIVVKIHLCCDITVGFILLKLSTTSSFTFSLSKKPAFYHLV